MLVLRRKKGEAVAIGENVMITVSDIGSDYVRIAIDAPREVSILRAELIEAAEVNRESAVTDQVSLDQLRNLLLSRRENTDK